MMMYLKYTAFKPLKMEIKVKISSLTTIIVHSSDDSSFAQLYIITFFIAAIISCKLEAPGVNAKIKPAKPLRLWAIVATGP